MRQGSYVIVLNLNNNVKLDHNRATLRCVEQWWRKCLTSTEARACGGCDKTIKSLALNYVLEIREKLPLGARRPPTTSSNFFCLLPFSRLTIRRKSLKLHVFGAAVLMKSLWKERKENSHSFSHSRRHITRLFRWWASDVRDQSSAISENYSEISQWFRTTRAAQHCRRWQIAFIMEVEVQRWETAKKKEKLDRFEFHMPRFRVYCG